jgi:uncharacterized protein (DUF305 family)
MKSNRKLGWLLSLALAVLVTAGLAACGDDEGSSSEKRDPKVERAFMQAMIPHHQSAVEMAQMAKEKGEHPKVKQLGDDIIAAQNREISQMKRIHERLFGETVKPDESAHHDLGLSAKEAGMEHTDMAGLQRADPFDRAFLDHMIPHHQGAIRMARAVIDKTRDSELMQLADDIVGGQSAEIEDMNGWRKQWYGGTSPAGGVPSGKSSSGGGKEHEGH